MASKDYLPERSPSEWKAHNKAAGEKAQADFSNSWDRYARKYLAWHGEVLSAEWEVAQSILRAPAVGTRYAFGKGGELAGLWDSDLHKDFRYHNLPAVQGYATFAHQAMAALTKDPVRAAVALSNPAVMLQVQSEAVEGWLGEHQSGFPWAKANPEAVEEIALTTFDPLWAAGYMTAAVKSGLLAAEMKVLTPIFANLRHLEAGEFLAEASRLHGADTINPSFSKAVKGMFNSGATDAEVAAEMYKQSYRASPWTLGLEETRMGKFFKRGGSLVSSGIRDIASVKTEYEQAIGHDRIRALESIPQFDTLWSDAGSYVGEKGKRFLGMATEGDLIQELMEKVPRDVMDPVRTFESNYMGMAYAGQVPTLPEATLRKASKAVAHARIGYEDYAATSALRKPGVHEASYQEIVKTRDTLKSMEKEHAAMLRRSHTDMEERTLRGQINKLYRKLVPMEAKHNAHVARTGGPGAMFEYNPRYSPAQSTVMAVEAKTEPLASSSGQQFRSWELERTGGPGRFQAAEDFRNWLASVSTRLKRANKIDEFSQLAGAYKVNLREGYLAADAMGDRVAALKLRRQYRMVSQLMRDLKQWKGTPDYIRAAKKAEPIPILKVYDKMLNVIRTGQVLGSPSVVVNNAIDSNVTKNAMESGTVGWRGLFDVAYTGKPSPAYNYNGQLMSFAGEPSTAVLGNVADPTLLGSKTLGRIRAGMAEVLDATETAARTHLGQVTYDKEFSRMVKAGIDPAVADTRAFTKAKAVVAEVHFDYGTQSSFDKIARRIWMYPVFGLRNNAFYIKKMIEHPAEFRALAELRKQQREGSIDGQGSVKIPGFDYATDPVGRMSPIRILDTLLNTKGELNPADQEDWRRGKLLQATMGSFTPPAEMVMQAIGALPPSQGGTTSSLESVGAILNKNLTGQEIYPSDWAYGLIGKDPKETRDAYRDRRAGLLGIAARREGYELTSDQAFALADHYDSISKYSSWAGQRLVPAGGKLPEVTKDLSDANWHLVNASPEFADTRKAMILAQQKYSDLAPVLPRTENERLRGSLFRSVTDEDRAEAERSIVGPKADAKIEEEKAEKLDTIQKSLESSPRLMPFRWLMDIMTPNAGAAEPEETMRSSDSMPRPDQSFKQDAKGNIVIDIPPGLSRRDEAALFKSAERQVHYLNTTFLDTASKMQGVDEIGKYVDGLKDKDGYNFAPALLLNLRSSPRVGPFAEQYLAYKSDGKDGNLFLAPPTMRDFRQNFTASYREWVAQGGIDAGERLKAPLSQVRAAAARGDLYMPGINQEAIGAIELRLAQRNIGGLVAGAAREHMDLKKNQYPDLGEFIGRLQRATTPGPAQEYNLKDAIKFGRDGMERGTIPLDAYDLLKKDPSYRDLNNRVEDAAMVQQTNQAWDFITFKKDGKEIGINPVALAQISTSSKYRDWGPAMAELASGRMGPQRAQWIASAIQDMPLETGKYVVAGIEAGGQNLDLHRSENLRAVTGQVAPEIQGFFRDVAAGTPLDTTAPMSREGAPVPPRTTAAPAQGAPMSTQPGIIPAADRPALGPAPSPINFSYSGLGASGGGISTTSQFMASAWNDYSVAHATWRNAGVEGAINEGFGFGSAAQGPEPSFAGSLAAKWKSMEAPGGGMSLAQMRVGVQGVQVAYQLASIGMAASGEEMPSEVNGAMAGLSTGLSVAASMGFTPVGLAVGAVAGIASGLMASQGGGKQQAVNSEANRINQERLDLQRQEFAERLRETSVRDLRTRESDLAKSLAGNTGFRPSQQSSERLAQFQRRPTYASKLGLIDQLERELATSLKPRW